MCAALAAALTTGVARANPIPAENLRPPTTQWLAAEAKPPAIEGYSSAVSAAPGETISFHVSTDPAASYQILVYRIGWYGGAGGTLVTCLPSCDTHLAGSPMPVSPPVGIFSEVRADWPASIGLTIPATWVSGYYLANLVLTSGPSAGSVDRVPFIVREGHTRRSQVLGQVPVNTWQAYNGWGGASLYEHSSVGGRRAAAVSFDRPYFIGAGSQEMTDWEIAFVRWLEREGYDISYQTDVDTHRDPAGLNAHRLVLMLGHDEYWTKEMRDGFEAARAAGTNLGFLGANAAYWQIRYANGERTIISYKSLYDPEPVLELKTALFREIGRVECALLGVQHQGGLQNWGRHDYVVTTAGASDPWMEGTGFVEGARIENVVSVERDTVPSSGCGRPVTVLFRYDAGSDTLGDAAAVRYTADSGARIFSTGTMELGWALDSYPGPAEGTARLDLRLRRFVANAMDDLTRPASARRVVALASGSRVRVVIEAAPDARVRWDVNRRPGQDDAPISDPGWRLICRAVEATCSDPQAPAGYARYAAVAVDQWGRSFPTFSDAIFIRPPAEPPLARGEVVVARQQVTQAGQTYDLFTVDLRRGSARRLTRGRFSEVQPSWSHDGKRLALTIAGTIDGVPPSPMEAAAVFVMNADGTNLRRLAPGRSPTWAPDGRSVALERAGAIYIVDVLTRRARKLAAGRNPAWSKRGKIAFARTDGIWTIGLAGRRQRLLFRPDYRLQPDSWLTEPPSAAYADAPAWSPDGRRIAFVNQQVGDDNVTASEDSRVHVANADGGNRRAYALDVSRPTWSSDGRWILGAGHDGRVCMTRIGRAASLMCLRLAGMNFDPAWRLAER